MKTRIEKIKEAAFHKVCFFLVWVNNPYLANNLSVARVILHDLGKILMIAVLGDRIATVIHRRVAGHHRLRSRADKLEAIVDWECARLNKPDKPLSARGTYAKYYPHVRGITEMLDEAGL